MKRTRIEVGIWPANCHCGACIPRACMTWWGEWWELAGCVEHWVAALPPVNPDMELHLEIVLPEGGSYTVCRARHLGDTVARILTYYAPDPAPTPASAAEAPTPAPAAGPVTGTRASHPDEADPVWDMVIIRG